MIKYMNDKVHVLTWVIDTKYREIIEATLYKFGKIGAEVRLGGKAYRNPIKEQATGCRDTNCTKMTAGAF